MNPAVGKEHKGVDAVDSRQQAKGTCASTSVNIWDVMHRADVQVLHTCACDSREMGDITVIYEEAEWANVRAQVKCAFAFLSTNRMTEQTI